MTVDPAAFRERLLAEQRALSRRRDQREPVTVQPCADPVDRIAQSQEADRAAASFSRDLAKLRLIREALARCADGTYGLCTQCEEPIPMARLNLLPWTPHCIRCAEWTEQQERERTEWPSRADLDGVPA